MAFGFEFTKNIEVLVYLGSSVDFQSAIFGIGAKLWLDIGDFFGKHVSIFLDFFLKIGKCQKKSKLLRFKF